MAKRTARLELTKTGGRSILNVSAPRDIGLKELAVLNTVIVEKVIKDLTGCACLSGVIDVIFQEQFERVIDVDLRGGSIIG
jgi:hypothetical protein